MLLSVSVPEDFQGGFTAPFSLDEYSNRFGERLHYPGPIVHPGVRLLGEAQIVKDITMRVSVPGDRNFF